MSRSERWPSRSPPLVGSTGERERPRERPRELVLPRELLAELRLPGAWPWFLERLLFPDLDVDLEREVVGLRLVLRDDLRWALFHSLSMGA